MDDDQVLRSMVRDDAYRVIRVLAEGPSGKTELVTLGNDELLVRKRIPKELANAAAWATVMGVSAPHLPRIESLYQMPDELVVVYAYVPGKSLRELVGEEGPVLPERAVGIIADVCEATAALHEAGIVHRDITPGNVIVASDGAYLVDLGIARRHGDGKRHDTTALGTWGFAAPEQFGFAQTDARSDVYSIGCLLGYLLTGVEPQGEAYERRLEDRGFVRPALARVVRTATSFEPSARYQQVSELSEAARHALGEGEVKSAPRVTTYEKNPPQSPNGTARSREKAPVRPQDGPTRTVRASTGQRVDGGAPPAAERVEAPAASTEPRMFYEAPLIARVAAIAWWSFMGLYVLLVLYTSGCAIVTHNPPWGPGEHLLGVVSMGGAMALSYEAYLALTHRSRYENARHRMGLFLLRTCILFAIIFIMMLACAALFYNPENK